MASICLLLAGCSSPAINPAPAPSPTSVPPAHTPVPTTPAAGLSSCPAPRPISDLPLIARPPIAPDDLLAMPDGSIWATDPVAGAVVHLGPSGALLQRISDPRAPEGMVALADGRLLLVEQRPNRLVTIAPSAPSPTVFLTLPPRGSQDGTDGLGDDSAGGRILVPDSPHGTLLSVPIGGGPSTMLAGGLGRDVAAAIGPDGNIWVAVEGDHGLYRVPAAGGAAQAVGAVSQLDDILSHGPLLYATAVTAGQVLAIDPATGDHSVLVTGIGSAQGLAVLPDGRLAVADSTEATIRALSGC